MRTKEDLRADLNALTTTLMSRRVFARTAAPSYHTYLRLLHMPLSILRLSEKQWELV